MGVQRGGEEHEAAIQRTLKAAHSSGKKAAIFCKFGECFRSNDWNRERHTDFPEAQTERMPTIARNKGSI